MSQPGQLSEKQRAILAALSDALIPADGDFPSATSADPSGRFLTRSLALVPRQARLVASLLDQVDATNPEDELRRIEREQPRAYEALINVVLGTYLTNRKIWKRIGYPGRRPRPPYPDEADYYLADDILDPVLKRGPFFRPTLPISPKGSRDGNPT